MEYTLHKKNVLGLEGSALWNRLVDSCVSATGKLNESIALKFPHDETKLVVIAKPTANCITLNGKSPSFTMSVTYEIDRNMIFFAGDRRSGTTVEGRHFTLFMDLDETGRACFTHRATDSSSIKVTPEDAASFLLRFSMLASPPVFPSPSI